METRSKTRLSLGLPPKKRSQDEIDDLRPPRPRKKIRAPPKKKFPLMKLPAEIRLEILRLLLVSDEPLEITTPSFTTYTSPQFDFRGNPAYTSSYPHPGYTPHYLPAVKNFDFCPAILRTNLALCEEGMQILYSENTVHVRLWCEEDYELDSEDGDEGGYDEGVRSQFLSPGWDMLSDTRGVEVPLKLRTSIQRLRVTISVPSYNGGREVREMIRAFIHRLQNFPSLKSLVVHMEKGEDEDVDEEDEEEAYPWSPDDVLRPFSLLRGLGKLSFTGMTPQNSSELVSLATSRRPVVNLPSMFHALRRYTKSNVWDYIEHQDLALALFNADSAMDHDRLEDFLKERQKVIDRTDEVLEKRRQDLFKCDPEALQEQRSGVGSIGLIPA